MPQDPQPAAPRAPQDSPAASVRWPELIVALTLMLLACMVITDSLRVGMGWADDGPQAGYFPFYIGLLLLGASSWVAGSTLWAWARLTKPFVMRQELHGVVAVFWPTVAYVGLIVPLGLYAASWALIAYFMRRHGRYGVPASLLVPAAIMAVIYFVFELWFLVPLPKAAAWAWWASRGE